MSKKIVLTGGGTAGHITPNIALLPGLKQAGYEVFYIGSYDGMEKRLMADFDIPYYGISTGKFRRYFDLKNFTDPFRVIKGCSEARKLLKQIQPDIVFSKGGFVSVPVVRAAASLKIPCVIHESDMTPGLANKLCIPAARKVCCNFPETLKTLPPEKSILTGSPIRQELLSGDKQAARKLCNFDASKPVLMVVGGSLGSAVINQSVREASPIRQELLSGDKQAARKLCNFDASKPVLMVVGGSLGSAVINQSVREALPALLRDFQIIHICGKDKIDNLLLNQKGYCQFEYVKEELKDLFALADASLNM